MESPTKKEDNASSANHEFNSATVSASDHDPKIGQPVSPSIIPISIASIGPSAPKIGPSVPKIGPSIGPSAPKIGPTNGSSYPPASTILPGQPANSSYGYSSPPSSSTYTPTISNSVGPAMNASANNLRHIRHWELKEHNNANSLWIGYKGYVYDATDYRHSGGLLALLRGSGKDATKMITMQHSWVKVDEILRNKRIGILVEQHDSNEDSD